MCVHQVREKVMSQKMELEHVFDHFPKYRMKMLLGDFKAEVEREDIFKPTTGHKSLQQDSNDNGVRLVNFATSKKSGG
jgi:hypothetical protein